MHEDEEDEEAEVDQQDSGASDSEPDSDSDSDSSDAEEAEVEEESGGEQDGQEEEPEEEEDEEEEDESNRDVEGFSSDSEEESGGEEDNEEKAEAAEEEEEEESEAKESKTPAPTPVAPPKVPQRVFRFDASLPQAVSVCLRKRERVWPSEKPTWLRSPTHSLICSAIRDCHCRLPLPSQLPSSSPSFRHSIRSPRKKRNLLSAACRSSSRLSRSPLRSARARKVAWRSRR